MALGRVILAGLVAHAAADLPIHCLNKDVAGTWKFRLTKGNHKNAESCGYKSPDNNRYHFLGNNHKLDPSLDGSNLKVDRELELELAQPNLVKQNGAIIDGDWTMVYDEGFEFRHDGFRFFAFSKYTPISSDIPLEDDEVADYVTNCDETLVGWYHTDVEGSENWGCFIGSKTNSFGLLESGEQEHSAKHRGKGKGKHHARKAKHHIVSRLPKPKHTAGSSAWWGKSDTWGGDMVALEIAVNAVNNDPKKTWKAKVHESFVGKTYEQMSKLLGRRTYDKHVVPEKLELVAVDAVQIRSASKHKHYVAVPDSWDWTAVQRGNTIVNYDTPIKDQGDCGSCYAMAAISAIESRIRIKTDNKEQPTLSAQNVVSCSRYNQGCEGGYPYLVGKHGMDFGLVDESCVPYNAKDHVNFDACPSRNGKCADGSQAKTYSLKSYRYVGDYYGGCDADAIQQELYQNGPMVIGFEAPESLFAYSSGIFSGPRPAKQLNGDPSVAPWQHTNHAVVLVGYGSENGKDYWKIKNTWGTLWGEHGYFRIERGNDNCGVESMAVAFDVDL